MTMQRRSDHKLALKTNVLYALSMAFVCLFLYTVYHKVAEIDAFTESIAQVPFIGRHANTVAWCVLCAEAAVSFLLIWPDTNRIGLWGSLGLMATFTLYITNMLLFAEDLPCHCGGAIEKFTWQQHLLFNSGFIILAIGLLLCHKQQVNYKSKKNENITLKN